MKNVEVDDFQTLLVDYVKEKGGQVIVRGALAPMVGRVSMDLTLADVTDIPGVEVGDEVVLIGACSGLRITAWDHAKLAETIPYEVLCGISKRVPRRYVE